MPLIVLTTDGSDFHVAVSVLSRLTLADRLMYHYNSAIEADCATLVERDTDEEIDGEFTRVEVATETETGLETDTAAWLLDFSVNNMRWALAKVEQSMDCPIEVT